MTIADTKPAVRDAGEPVDEYAAAEQAARSDDVGCLRQLLIPYRSGWGDCIKYDGPGVSFLRPVFATAVAHSSLRVVEVLVEALGVDVCLDARTGWTALHVAAFLNAAVVAELLLSEGASVHLRSNSGQTPLQVATTYGNEEVCEVLRGDVRKQTSPEPAEVGVEAPALGAAAPILRVPVDETKRLEMGTQTAEERDGAVPRLPRDPYPIQAACGAGKCSCGLCCECEKEVEGTLPAQVLDEGTFDEVSAQLYAPWFGYKTMVDRASQAEAECADTSIQCSPQAAECAVQVERSPVAECGVQIETTCTECEVQYEPLIGHPTLQRAETMGKLLRAVGVGRHLQWKFDEFGGSIAGFADGMVVGGLAQGDRLVAINDKQVEGLPQEQILRSWKAERGASHLTALFFKRGPSLG